MRQTEHGETAGNGVDSRCTQQQPPSSPPGLPNPNANKPACMRKCSEAYACTQGKGRIPPLKDGQSVSAVTSSHGHY